MPASNTESGAATPAPFPVALMMPTISGMMKAAENTGPMNPTDCATTSTSDSFAPPSRSYPVPSSNLSISVATQAPFG